jgi:hypothetical protein
MMKTCSKCGAYKAYSEFAENTNGRGVGGRRANCKACDTLRAKERRDRIRCVEREVKTEKKCYRCEQVKPISEFGKSNHLKDGYCSNCKDCENKKARDNRAKRKKEDPKKYKRINKNNNFKRLYGITLEEFDQMFERAGSQCEICSKGLVKEREGSKGPTDNVAVLDHCHTTGTVRAILCSQCNTALGLMKEDPTKIRQLADYAEKWVDKK